MKWLPYILLILTLPVFGQYTDTIFLNPTGSGDTLTTWGDVTFTNKTLYLQKCGTEMEGLFSIDNKDTIKISYYGTGEMPIISGDGTSTAIVELFRSADITFKGIHWKGDAPTTAQHCFDVRGYWSTASQDSTYNILWDSCEFSYAYDAFTVVPGTDSTDCVFSPKTRNLTIKNCYIHHMDQDGALIYDSDYFTVTGDTVPWGQIYELSKTTDDFSSVYEFQFTWIRRCNMSWHWNPIHNTGATANEIDQAHGGDGLHFSSRENRTAHPGCNHYLIENTVVDNRFTANKFEVIHQTFDYGFDAVGIIRNCMLFGKKDTTYESSTGGVFYIYKGDSCYLENVWVVGSHKIYEDQGGGDGIGGEFNVDHLVCTNLILDSVTTFRAGFFNDEITLNNVTATGSESGSTMFMTGNWYLNDCVIAATTGTTTFSGTIQSQDSTSIITGTSGEITTATGWTNWEDGDYSLIVSSPLINQASADAVETDIYGNAKEGVRDRNAIEYITDSEPAPDPPSSRAGKGLMINGKLLIKNGKIIKN